MTDGQLIEFDHATKRFGAVAAVSDLSARVNPGVVTGFLGPNGAGKTTTLRMLLGLERPTSGTATIGGSRYAELRSPARIIGAMLEDPGFRARRTVERHLITAAKANGIPLSRVGELIAFVGLGDDVDTRIAALSLGMRQRLSAATALIGDPGVLVLDEPANGLDPEGIRWMRTLIRGLADEGRTVLVSSHVLSEVEQIADEILVISRGELKFAGTMEDLADPRTGPVVVDAADRDALSAVLKDAGYEFEILRSGLTVRGSDAETIGRVTAQAGVALTTLQQRGPTLEDVFLDVVNDRYVRPEPPASADALFELDGGEDADGSDEGLRVPSSEAPAPAGEETPASVPETSAEGAGIEGSPVQDDLPQVDSPQEATPQDDPSEEPRPQDAPSQDALSQESPPRDVERAEGETKRAERAERVEATAPASAPEDRPLPGVDGLAAVASLFAAADSDPDESDEEDDAEAAEAETAGDETTDAEAADAETDGQEDLDATRAIDVVPPADDHSTEDPRTATDQPEGDDR